MRAGILLAGVGTAVGCAWLIGPMLSITGAGRLMLCLATLILGSAIAVNRLVFANDRFAQAVLYAVALPVFAYLLYVGLRAPTQ